jgi:hypothetical protein
VPKPFIHCDTKKSGVYASIYTPRWENKKKINDIENLGRVIDLEKGIFKNRQYGVFHFDFNNGYKILEPPVNKKVKSEEYALIFGNIYTAYHILDRNKYIELFNNIDVQNKDLLITLILFRLLTDEPYCNAQSWWNSTYAKILFPQVSISSQRISEFLVSLGTKTNLELFFKKYLELIYGSTPSCGVVIDSTGAPNDISVELTKINNHNGIINNEIRLIYVMDRVQKTPIYFRVVAGNIVDVTTLKQTINELKSLNIDVLYSVLDAGYYSDDNVKFLYSNNVPFITRIGPNRIIAKELFSKHFDSIKHMKNSIIHNNRLLYVKKFEFNLQGRVAYAYIAIDDKRRNEEIYSLVNNEKKNKKMTGDEMELETKFMGSFILISSIDLPIDEILPYYSSRNYIEQIFDISKNNAMLLPLRVHSIEGIKGHILINFLTVISYLSINKCFYKTKYCAKNAFYELSFLIGKILNDKIHIYEPNKKIKEVIKLFNIDIPDILPFKI